jgi:phosphoadenosine phosphosulfate reductase
MYITEQHRPHTIERRPGFDAARAHAELVQSGLSGHALIERALENRLSGRTAIVSSFGAESVVLLALVADIDPGLPVLFLQTNRHFPETLDYRHQVARHLGLTDVRDIAPDPADERRLDPTGELWWFDPDACCDMRKVHPLADALDGFDCWISGRKRHQAATRQHLPEVELEHGRIKLNPLAGWSASQIRDTIARLDLPPHPLVAAGYQSIGCANCTRAVGAGEDERAGRWSGVAKVECGIHRAA